MNYLEGARSIFETGLEIRRTLHTQPEVGFDLPKTAELVEGRLDELGISHRRLGETYAVIGSLGDPSRGRTLLLRADMDALPISEEGESDFKSENDHGHLCGHDLHTTILLMALELLKEDEDLLEGQVAFLFQPGEETLNGGSKMVEAGLLDEFEPDGGLALHMDPNAQELSILVPEEEALTSALNFRITVTGKGAHGATPYKGVDPVFVASQILNAANGILAREIPSNKGASLSMGHFQSQAGAVNVVPNKVEIEGTARSLYPETADHLASRLPEVVHHIGQAFRAQTDFEVLADCPALVNSPDLASQVMAWSREALGGDYPVKTIGPLLASDDYAHLASRLPESCYFFVGCPKKDSQGQTYSLHHPQVLFDEEALVLGSATMATGVRKWLEDHK